MKPKLLKNNHDYEMALKYIESLMEQPESKVTNEEIELFTSLISSYEEKYFPVDLPNPIDAILFVMDQQGLERKDLIPIIGSQSKVSEILNRKRPLSLSMIRRLHEELNIPAEILLQDTQQNQVPEKQFIYEDYPVSEMYKLGYFPNFHKI
jgi:HTH-type transcriptional regulator/antitoxin HigA